MNEDLHFMQEAYQEAQTAFAKDEVPVGCVIVSEYNEVIASTYNLKETENNPCGHAEILAIQMAAQNLGDWRLLGATVYVTLEPCPMCYSALIQARVKRVVFGAYDRKGGALSLGYNFHLDKRLNHTFSIVGGVNHFECSQLLSKFFRQKRDRHLSK